MKTLKETLDEFDELNIFSTPITKDGLRTFVVDIQEAKDFISQEIKTALESVEKELIYCSTIDTNTIEIYREIKNKYLNEPEKNDICEFWRGSEKCTDKKADGSIFCRFHCDNLPF